MEQVTKAGGVFRWWITEADGSLALDEYGLPRFGEMHNGNTTGGLNYVLNTALANNASQITTWYGGLIDNSGFSALATADTLSSHAGWTENTQYTGNRQPWGPGAASGASITNSSAIVFPITGTCTIYGLFICSAASGTSGTLFSTAAFSSPQSLINGQNLNVTYTYSMS